MALLHAGLPKSRFHDIVGLFQEHKEVADRFCNDVPPQYLVGTTKLLGVGLTLTKARRMVQLDPEWLLRDELQARRRINQITQTGQTYSYSLRCIGSNAKNMIADRQNRRDLLLKQALDPTANIEPNDIKRGIGEYSKSDDEDGEEEGGMVEI